ncbi:MAG TPA: EF-P lysine aminoacylase GenX [Gammaproteobacteria bacterium]|nr:EF-P lysine aminoacylase GenX [Gammaproteobacteria bacterium]
MTYERAASLAALRVRAEVLARIRAFFAARGVLEVETPALSGAAPTDPAIESIAADVRSLGGRRFLHTSPELAMKRLLASGSGDIYQMCRVFRDDELGRWHEPEFTLLEWYRIGFDDARLMDEVAELAIDALGGAASGWPVSRVPYRAAFEAAVGIDPLESAGGIDPPEGAVGGGDSSGGSGSSLSRPLGTGLETRLPTRLQTRLETRLRALGVDVPAGLDADALLDLAFSALVLPGFRKDALTFVHDYPASQAALAKLKPGSPRVAARFELFAGGLELANGFAELTDAAEQRRRFEADLQERRARGQPEPPIDEAFLAALEHGMPECAGVALGVDRLVALAAREPSLAGVLAFTHRR